MNKVELKTPSIHNTTPQLKSVTELDIKNCSAHSLYLFSVHELSSWWNVNILSNIAMKNLLHRFSLIATLVGVGAEITEFCI